MHPLLRHLGRAALVVALAWPGAPGHALAATMVAPANIRPKDFTLVKKDGVYHLFYIRHNDALPPWATEIDFGHAISFDLHHWTQLAPVLGLDPAGWDNLHVWAPHVVEWNGLWWMFYTGVTDAPGFRNTQRIGTAISSDLYTWNRVFMESVWSTASAPWAWWAPLSPRMACRDPFVMPDPKQPGHWLMYYTGTPASDTLADIVGVARSTGEPGLWTDLKPLWITHHSWSFNTSTESPHVFEHAGQWFLFITSNAGQPLSFFVGSDPTGEPETWRYRGRLRNMLGYDTSEWFASEYMKDGTHDLFAYASGNHIDIQEMAWSAPDTFSLVSPPLFHMVEMAWSGPTTNENQFVGLTLRSVNPTAFDGELVGWVKTGSGPETSVPLDSLGMPPRPVLTSGEEQIAWFVHRWPRGLPESEPMSLRVAMGDGTASTPWLRIHPNPIEPQPFAGSIGRASDVPVAPDSVAGPPATIDIVPDRTPVPEGEQLRVLTGSPLGPGPVVTFGLGEPAPARLDVFDVLGRRVATLAERTFGRGAHAVPWDGRGLDGRAARRGLYFVRLSTRDRMTTAKFMLER